MANEFSITTATNAVQLDSQNQAIATFTIFNASGGTVSGRAALATVPDSQPFAAWLQIDGSAERSFDIGGTEQYVIKIVAPADTPAGSYTFRLNMVETENPDEGFNPGPSITFTVPEPVEPVKKFPMWIIPAIIGGLLVIGAIIYFATRGPGTIEVPDVIGMTGDNAQDALEDAGLRQRQGQSEFSGTVAEGLVARSDPPAGEMVEPNSRVVWLLSEGREPTPTPTPTMTPSPTPTPTQTPPPTPNMTATAQALIDASIEKYVGSWELSSGSGFLRRLTIEDDSQTIFVEAFGSGYYVDGDANSVAALACPLTFPQGDEDCAYFRAKGQYQGDPISLTSVDSGDIIVHLLTFSVTENGEILSVVDQVLANGVTIATDVYAMKRPAPIFIGPIITISALEFGIEFPQLVITPSP